MSYKLGFAGCGNMAGAIIRGIIKSGLLDAGSISVYDPDESKTAQMAGEGANVCRDLDELQAAADILFLCVKPNIIPAVLAGITRPGLAVVSIAAGIRSDKIKSLLKVDARVLRIMPNTPLMEGKGGSGFEVPNELKKEEYVFVKNIFNILGKVVEVEGRLMDAVTGISGSGPAYMYYFLKALADAGQRQGLDPADSVTLALQTMQGAAEMVQQSGKPLDTLIREVCSPGGTTIEALAVFDEMDLSGIVDKAVDACTKKSVKLSGM